MFKGTYRHRIDAKGRVPVPAPFRRALAASGEAALVATRLDECLAVYPGREWARLEAQLSQLPAFNKNVKALTRALLSRAVDCEVDVQGRILLPSELRSAAGLAREAVLVGVLNRVEIWSPEAWDRFLRESERLLDDTSLDVQWPLPPSPPSAGASGEHHPQPKSNR